jgi:hypothetical protein
LFYRGAIYAFISGPVTYFDFSHTLYESCTAKSYGDNIFIYGDELLSVRVTPQVFEEVEIPNSASESLRYFYGLWDNQYVSLYAWIKEERAVYVDDEGKTSSCGDIVNPCKFAYFLLNFLEFFFFLFYYFILFYYLLISGLSLMDTIF